VGLAALPYEGLSVAKKAGQPVVVPIAIAVHARCDLGNLQSLAKVETEMQAQLSRRNSGWSNASEKGSKPSANSSKRPV
jgi:hypothetical protein